MKLTVVYYLFVSVPRPTSFVASHYFYCLSSVIITTKRKVFQFTFVHLPLCGTMASRAPRTFEYVDHREMAIRMSGAMNMHCGLNCVREFRCAAPQAAAAARSADDGAARAPVSPPRSLAKKS